MKTYEEREVKPPAYVPVPPPKEKKKLITPEDKAKQNTAKSLFGGPKGPAAKPAPASNPIKPP